MINVWDLKRGNGEQTIGPAPNVICKDDDGGDGTYLFVSKCQRSGPKGLRNVMAVPVQIIDKYEGGSSRNEEARCKF